MAFIMIYDPLFDESFQSEIAIGTARKAIASGVVNVSETPFDGLPIASRFRSDRHPGWADAVDGGSSDESTNRRAAAPGNGKNHRRGHRS
jgi:hypothetical protein